MPGKGVILDIICAWCGKKLGEKEGEGTTHGICDDCLLLHFPHHYAKIKGILEVENIEDIYKKGGNIDN